MIIKKELHNMLNKKDYLNKTADFVDFLVNEIDPTKKPIIFSKPNHYCPAIS